MSGILKDARPTTTSLVVVSLESHVHECCSADLLRRGATCLEDSQNAGVPCVFSFKTTTKRAPCKKDEPPAPCIGLGVGMRLAPLWPRRPGISWRRCAAARARRRRSARPSETHEAKEPSLSRVTGRSLSLLLHKPGHVLPPCDSESESFAIRLDPTRPILQALLLMLDNSLW